MYMAGKPDLGLSESSVRVVYVLCLLLLLICTRPRKEPDTVRSVARIKRARLLTCIETHPYLPLNSGN